MTHTWAITCTYCGEVVYGSPEDLADPLLDHWKEQCPSHPRRKEAMSARCGAVLKSYDSRHYCGYPPGHDGPHRCEVCLTTWTTPGRYPLDRRPPESVGARPSPVRDDGPGGRLHA